MIDFTCPHCSQRLRVGNERGGLETACNGCGKPVRAPNMTHWRAVAIAIAACYSIPVGLMYLSSERNPDVWIDWKTLLAAALMPLIFCMLGVPGLLLDLWRKRRSKA